MPSVYENDRVNNSEVKIGQWIRIKNSGVYNGDIGILEGVEDAKVYVRLIPRVDLSGSSNDKGKKFVRIPQRINF